MIKDLMIVLIVILLLLTLISTFGGAVHIEEKFTDVSSTSVTVPQPLDFIMPSKPTKSDKPVPSKQTQVNTGAAASTNTIQSSSDVSGYDGQSLPYGSAEIEGVPSLPVALSTSLPVITSEVADASTGNVVEPFEGNMYATPL